MQIREANINDLDTIMVLETSCFANDAWSKEVMASELAARHTTYVIGLEGEKVVGYAGLSKLEVSKQADIQTIALAPEYRGKGFGRALMNELLAKAISLGAEEVFLEVRADNEPAKQLYLSLGFEQIGLRRNYYQPDNIDAIVMRADVK